MNETLHTKFGNAKLYSDGYYMITSGKEGNHCKKLHRLIWEDFYGCKVPEGYIIHHKNGNKTDNCILNLQLMRKGKHNSLHVCGENHPRYGKGDVDYARILRGGSHDGIQDYMLVYKGERLKYSRYKNKLIKWFKNNYSNDILIKEENIYD